MSILKLTDDLTLGISHLGVDFTCTALLAALSQSLSPWQVLVMAVVYNGLAFAFQLPVGALADQLALGQKLAALGCCLVAVGAMLPSPVLACVLMGLGNACFHIGGGRKVLRQSGSRAGAVGRFVAPGAIGIFLGPKLSGFSWLSRGVLPLCLLTLAAVLYRSCREKEFPVPSPLSLSRLRLAGGLGCMFLTVLLRAYIGTALAYPLLSNGLFALAFTLCIFGGKFFGGSLADRFGTLGFSALSQGICVLLLVLSIWMPLLALPAIFLFNTTMAITANQLYRALPPYPGTMFGLTTFALYLGTLPRLLGWKNPFFNGWGLGLLGLLSAALLVGGLALMKGGGHRDRNSPVPGDVPEHYPAS